MAVRRARDGTAGSYELRALRPGDWPLVERLFGSNGACGGCWCMWWRLPRGGKAWEAAKGEGNRRALQRLVEQGACRAILAFQDGEPVGWCSFGPREDFPRIANSRKLRRARPAPWSVNCFFIDRAHRKRGLSGLLLAAASEAAFRAGASAIEGYPVLPRDGDFPGTFAWTGLPGAFERAGFRRMDEDAGARAIYERGRP
ncbi:MAG: GNAT family N-acetyltransferase [Alphaproteobacteria bacterium]|nr:GNAT family N-acetyltransferase [Alphaproteobacteria bacterium]